MKTFLLTDPPEREHVIIVTITWSKQIEIDAVRDHRIASRRRTALRFGTADELRIGLREHRLRIQRRCEMQRRDSRRRRLHVIRGEVEAVIVNDIDVADHFRNEFAQSPPRRGTRIRIESSTLTRCGDQIAAHRRPVARNHDRVVTGSDDRIIDQRKNLLSAARCVARHRRQRIGDAQYRQSHSIPPPREARSLRDIRAASRRRRTTRPLVPRARAVRRRATH